LAGCCERGRSREQARVAGWGWDDEVDEILDRYRRGGGLFVGLGGRYPGLRRLIDDGGLRRRGLREYPGYQRESGFWRCRD
jgi:hypothetical protein